MIASEPHSLLILYGSQTGCAQEVAEEVGEMARRRFFNPRVMAMDAYAQAHLDDLDEEPLVFFVASTTGEGTCPDNMAKFWRFLLRRDLPRDSLSRMCFSVFGLGDSSYSKFNAVARRLNARLLQLGATAVHERGLGDDQSTHGFLSDLDPWLQALWPVVLQRFPLPPGYNVDDAPHPSPLGFSVKWTAAAQTQAQAQAPEVPPVPATEQPSTSIGTVAPAPPPDAPTPPEVPASKFYQSLRPRGAHNTEPILARVLQNERMTAPDWEQDVRHVELDIATASQQEPAVSFAAGDVALVHPQNGPTDEIDAFAHERLGVEPGATFSIVPIAGAGPNRISADDIPSPCTVRDLLKSYLDVLGTPRRRFFRQLSLYTSDEEEQEKLLELAGTEGADLLYDYCTREKRTYIEVLTDFPKVSLPLERLIELVPRLQPRAFSIASSLLASPGRVQLCVAIVRFKTPWKRERVGVCSRWLRALAVGSEVRLWLQPGLLRLPPLAQLRAKPLLMIGPGTGVAPMRAMMQERAALLRSRSAAEGEVAAEGASLALYFGCRHEKKDFLYADELRAAIGSGTGSGGPSTLDALRLAFSRDQAHKVYVQTRLMENAAEVWRVLALGGFIYVAGSANRMPSDVREAIESIAQREGGLSAADAANLLTKMERSGRFVVEAWS